MDSNEKIVLEVIKGQFFLGELARETESDRLNITSGKTDD